MFLIRYILFLLLILICELPNNTKQNDISLLTNEYQQRIKRFLSHKLFKSKLNSERQSEKNQPEDLLLNFGQSYQTDQPKQSPKETNKVFTQQEIAEINRILSKKEDDYYGILNINKHATLQDVNHAYKKLCRRVHPDKLDVHGATEATQKLNKAHDRLKQKFENQNQNTNRQTTIISTTRLATFKENKNRETTDIFNQSNSFQTSSSLPTTSRKNPSNTSSNVNNFTYLLFASIILTIGIIILIIFYKKRQHHSSPYKNNFKKQNIHSSYETPDSNDDDGIRMNEYSEASSTQDED